MSVLRIRFWCAAAHLLMPSARLSMWAIERLAMAEDDAWVAAVGRP